MSIPRTHTYTQKNSPVRQTASRVRVYSAERSAIHLLVPGYWFVHLCPSSHYTVMRIYRCSINCFFFFLFLWLRGEGLLKTTLDLFHQAEAGHQTQLSGRFSFSAHKLRSLRQMKSLVKTDRYVIKSSSHCSSVRHSISAFGLGVSAESWRGNCWAWWCELWARCQLPNFPSALWEWVDPLMYIINSSAKDI